MIEVVDLYKSFKTTRYFKRGILKVEEGQTPGIDRR